MAHVVSKQRQQSPHDLPARGTDESLSVEEQGKALPVQVLPVPLHDAVTFAMGEKDAGSIFPDRKHDAKHTALEESKASNRSLMDRRSFDGQIRSKIGEKGDSKIGSSTAAVVGIKVRITL